MNCAILLQARMTATRLPGKVLLPLGDWPVIDWCLRRLSPVAPVVPCIPETAADDVLAAHLGLSAVRGSESDLLARFASALDACGEVLWLVRATADNPLVLPELIAPAVEIATRDGADYCSIEGTALGTTVEIIRKSAFEQLLKIATDPTEREHATLGLLRRPESFRIARYVAPAAYRSSVRLTLDTAADYTRLAALIAQSSRPPEAWTWPDIDRALARVPDAPASEQHLYAHVQSLKEHVWNPAPS